MELTSKGFREECLQVLDDLSRLTDKMSLLGLSVLFDFNHPDDIEYVPLKMQDFHSFRGYRSIRSIVDFLKENGIEIEVTYDFDSFPIPREVAYINNETIARIKSGSVKDLQDKIRILKETFSDGDEKIVIQIDEEKKEVMLKDKPKLKHSFRKTHGINKRFEYLIKIHQIPKIGGSDLGSKTLQNVSKEIKKLNEKLGGSLKLSDDLIINKDKTGYEINPKYKFEFI